MAKDSAPPPSMFTTPKKYLDNVKSTLTQMEHKAKNALDTHNNENLNNNDENEEVEDEEEDQGKKIFLIIFMRIFRRRC